MRKLVAVLVVVMFLGGGLAWAGQEQRTLLDAVRLTKAAPNSSEVEAGTKGDKRVAFFVTYNSSSNTGAVTAKVSAAISYDGEHWAPASWYDYSGGTTPQSSEELSKSGSYMMWFDTQTPIPYIRVRASMPNATLGNYGTDQYVDVTVTLIEDK